MKNWFISALALCAAGVGWAQEVGRVISSTPITQQISVPRRVCNVEQMSYQQPNSGAGAILGAIAGAAIGNSVGGRGADRAAATAIGMVGGAVIGDRVEGPGGERVQSVERCTIQNFVENRTSGYQVLYEYGGRQYSVQMAQDPGSTIPVQVAPASGTYSQNPAGNTVISSSGQVYIQPSVTYVTVPAPSVYYPVATFRPLFAPPVIFPGAYEHHERRFWR
jgi:uncharacterized protein YcfJ